MANLKQGTLSFTSAKRSQPTPDGKSQKKTPAKSKNKRVETQVEAQNDTKPRDILEISSDEDGPTVAEIVVPTKRTRTSTKKRLSSGTTEQEPPQPSPSEKPSQVKIEREHLDVEDKTGRYRRYYNEVRSKMGHLQPVHSEGQNKIHQMLRSFDMSYEYGPCIGMTRLERWERAKVFGLNPPPEVRDILLTKEGIEKDEYSQCVLHGEV